MGEVIEADGEGGGADGFVRGEDALARVVEPDAAEELGEGAAGETGELPGEGGLAHAGEAEDFREREGLGVVLEHAADDALDASLVAGAFADAEFEPGERLRFARSDGGEVAEDFQDEAEAGRRGGSDHGLEALRDVGAVFGAEEQAMAGALPEGLERGELGEGAEGVIERPMKLQGVAGGAAEAVPAVRKMRAEEDEFGAGKRGDVIADDAHALSALNAGELHFAMQMPALSGALDRGDAAESVALLHVLQIIAPAEEPEGLARGRGDGFDVDGHGGGRT